MPVRIGPWTRGMVSTDNLIFFVDSYNMNASFITGSGSPNSMWRDMTGNAVAADISSVKHSSPHLNFNGTNSRASFAASKVGNLTNIFETGATISAWIRPESDGEGDLGRILDKATWNLLVQSESGALVEMAFGTSQATNPGKWSTQAGSHISLNTWSHVVVTFTSVPVDAEDPVFYVNGQILSAVDEDSTPSGGNVSDINNPLIVGNDSGQTRTFDGDIDVVKIWDKILTAAEVLAEYNSLKDRFQ